METSLDVKYVPVFFFLHKEIMKEIEKGTIVSAVPSGPIPRGDFCSDPKSYSTRNPLNPYYGGRMNLRYEPGLNLNVDPHWLWPDYGGGARMTRPTPTTFFGDRYSQYAVDILNRYLPSDSFEQTVSGHNLYFDNLILDETGELKALINNDLATFNLVVKFWNRQPLEGELEYLSFSDIENQAEEHEPLIHYVHEVVSNFSSDPQLKLMAEIDNVAIINLFSQFKRHRFNLVQNQ